jgi:hypothetical protein
VALIGCVLLAEASHGIDLDVTAADIEAVLTVARGSERDRARFHEPYVFVRNHPMVERLEVITERRRLMLIAETRIEVGDRMFLHGLRPATEALRPFRRQVAVAAYLRFGQQHAYVSAPPVEVELGLGASALGRLAAHSETLYGPAPSVPSDPHPVVGARGEAVFDAAAVGQSSRIAVVRLQGKELTSLLIDFSRLP